MAMEAFGPLRIGTDADAPGVVPLLTTVAGRPAPSSRTLGEVVGKPNAALEGTGTASVAVGTGTVAGAVAHATSTSPPVGTGGTCAPTTIDARVT